MFFILCCNFICHSTYYHAIYSVGSDRFTPDPLQPVLLLSTEPSIFTFYPFLLCFDPQVYKIRGLAPISGSLALMFESRKLRVPVEDWREKECFLPIVWQWRCSSIDNSSHGVISFPYFGSTSGSGTTVPSICPFRLWHSDNSSLLGVVH